MTPWPMTYIYQICIHTCLAFLLAWEPEGGQEKMLDVEDICIVLYCIVLYCILTSILKYQGTSLQDINSHS